MRAVATVIYNRFNKPNNTDNYIDICTKPSQFVGFSRGKKEYEAGTYDEIMWDCAMDLAKDLVAGCFEAHPLLGPEYLYFFSESSGNEARRAQIKAKPETIILGGNMFFINY